LEEPTILATGVALLKHFSDGRSGLESFRGISVALCHVGHRLEIDIHGITCGHYVNDIDNLDERLHLTTSKYLMPSHLTSNLQRVSFNSRNQQRRKRSSVVGSYRSDNDGFVASLTTME